MSAYSFRSNLTDLGASYLRQVRLAIDEILDRRRGYPVTYVLNRTPAIRSCCNEFESCHPASSDEIRLFLAITSAERTRHQTREGITQDAVREGTLTESTHLMSQQSPTNSTAALVAAVAVATSECNAIMNEQFIALTRIPSEVAAFDAKIVECVELRRQAMATLLDHIAVHGW